MSFLKKILAVATASVAVYIIVRALLPNEYVLPTTTAVMLFVVLVLCVIGWRSKD